MNRLRTDFVSAFNASAHALNQIMVFWLTLVIEALLFVVRLIEYARTWFESGCPRPEWLRFGKVWRA